MVTRVPASLRRRGFYAAREGLDVDQNASWAHDI
jgi:hypothetical protein